MVEFNELTFSLGTDRTKPVGTESSKQLNQSFISHLEDMDQHGLLSENLNSGNIVFADDQFVNQQFMQMSFNDLGLQSKLKIFSNGVETVEYFSNILSHPGLLESKQPISLLILDINMPGLNGFECAKQIKQLYKENAQKTKGK